MFLYKDLVPVTVEVPVPFEYHRFIIGQRGREIRMMMDEYEVDIAVPQADMVSNHIVVSGPVRRVEQAKQALERKVQQLDAEKEDRVSLDCCGFLLGCCSTYLF